MTEPIDLRAAALAAREVVYAAHKAFREHARRCANRCEFDLWWACKDGKKLQQAVNDAADAAWTAVKAYVPAGTTVVYHGSLTEHHGEWTVKGVTAQSYGSAVTLARNNGSAADEVLSHVRVESFTIAQPAEQLAGSED